jgi:hypothetical protein
MSKTLLHVCREEHVGTVAGLDERADLGASGSGVVGLDLQP